MPRLRRYRHRGDFKHLLREHYLSFFAPMGSCADPISLFLTSGPPLVWEVFAGCLHPAAKWDLPDIISVNPSLDARPPTPAVPQGALTCFFPCVIGLPQVYTRSASRECPLKRLRSGWVFRSCRHFVMFWPPVSLALQIVPTAVHNCDRAARAFTSEPIMLRYLCMLRICLPSEYRQLTARLAPLKIHSLIGCSEHTCQNQPASPAECAIPFAF